MATKVVMRESGLPLREPNETCEACGAHGTVGRAMRTDDDGYPAEIHRFCAPCWPENSARLKARWDEEQRLAVEASVRGVPHTPVSSSTGYAFESATWHGALEYVREINRAFRPPEPPSPRDLARIAQTLAALAPERVGPMPFEIEVFIQTHGGHET